MRLSIFTDIDERQYDDLVYNVRKILVKMVFLISRSKKLGHNMEGMLGGQQVCLPLLLHDGGSNLRLPKASIKNNTDGWHLTSVPGCLGSGPPWFNGKCSFFCSGISVLLFL